MRRGTDPQMRLRHLAEAADLVLSEVPLGPELWAALCVGRKGERILPERVRHAERW